MNASAPAKVILLGEHAVVYEQPAIAVPVSSLRAHAAAAAAPAGSGLTVIARDLNQTLPINVDSAVVENALALAARLALRELNLPAPDMTITVTSDIPLASGLGSGAAVSAALMRALAEALGTSLPNERLNELVYEVEKLHHGWPSGIDNTVIVYEQPILYQRNRPIETIRIGAPFHLLIGDTGKGALTRIAVGDVRKLVQQAPNRYQPVIDSIGQLVREARRAIEAGDAQALGPLLIQNHALLQTLTVSSPELDCLVDAALSAGALGAKLSGGGRGGNMIALVTPSTARAVRQALMRAGAARVFETTIA